MEDVQKIKVLLGLDLDDDQDELIQVLLNQADAIIKGNTRYPKRFKPLKYEAVVVAYNQLGAEGQKGESSTGISRTFAYSTMTQFIKSNMPAPYRIK